jgi:hypothetical protein
MLMGALQIGNGARGIPATVDDLNVAPIFHQANWQKSDRTHRLE